MASIHPAKKTVLILAGLVSFLELFTGITIIPQALELDVNRFVFANAGMTGGLGFLDLVKNVSILVAALVVATIVYAALTKKKSLRGVEKDDGTLTSKSYLKVLYYVVSKAYLVLVLAAGIIIGIFSSALMPGHATSAHLAYGIILAYCITEVTGWGKYTQKPRKPITMHAAPEIDRNQESLTKYS